MVTRCLFWNRPRPLVAAMRLGLLLVLQSWPTRECSVAMQIPWVWAFYFLEGVVFADMDDLAAHTTWYFGSGL